MSSNLFPGPFLKCTPILYKDCFCACQEVNELDALVYFGNSLITHSLCLWVYSCSKVNLCIQSALIHSSLLHHYFNEQLRFLVKIKWISNVNSLMCCCTRIMHVPHVKEMLGCDRLTFVEFQTSKIQPSSELKNPQSYLRISLYCNENIWTRRRCINVSLIHGVMYWKIAQGLWIIVLPSCL